MRRLGWASAFVVTLALGVGVPGPAVAAGGQTGGRAAAAPATRTTGDFNGDGFGDAAIGVALEDVGTAADAGAVNVIDGSAAGLTSASNQLWTRTSVGGAAQANASFGFAVAVGDFNADGYSDLAIGAPNEDVGAAAGAGAVTVLYGSAAGLTAAGDQVWTQDTAGVLGRAEGSDGFGFAVAGGDLNGDGFSDLAIGVPFEDVCASGAADVARCPTQHDAGAVNVLYGSPTGLSATGNQLWSQNTLDVLGTAEPGDNFGWAVATGDTNGDGSADLGTGVPFEDVCGTGGVDAPGCSVVVDAGVANVLYGSPAGLSATGNQVWSQNTPGVGGTSDAGDLFGYDLIAGDFGGTSHADLAVSAPLEDPCVSASADADVAGCSVVLDAGAVNVLYGSAAGLTSAGNQLWREGVGGLPGTMETGAGFGNALAAADMGNGAQTDLGVAAAGDTVGTNASAGSATVIYGSPTGLIATGAQLWTQDSPNIIGKADANDEFGFDLWAVDVGNGPEADLLASAGAEDVCVAGGADARTVRCANITDAGAENVIYGSPAGITSTGNQFWNQNSPGIVGTAEGGDAFGFAVT